MPYITHPNGQRTHYLEDDFTDPWKPAETIVIQHGFARHAAFWYHWIPVLSRHYRVVRRDARGHGHSSYPPFPNTTTYDYSVETIVDEVVDTLDQLDLRKVHFIGESTSGILGCILAAKYPERLHSLTLCSSPTVLPPVAQALFAFGQRDWPTACLQLGSRGWGEQLAKLPGTLSIPDQEYVKWWIDQVEVSHSEGLAGYADFLCKIDCRDVLKDIKVPTLILAPMRSAATSVEEQRSIQASIPGARLELIDAAGHEIYVQKPEDCQKEFLNFVQGLSQA
ncbi:alpha/beta-hydrolase [Cadophora sp. DSE1049]|nr:alpha/beta-hydrolase [Cadophora sp. DSE1049]